ncbi:MULTISPECIES: DNA-binding transcriptional repressor CitR [Enterobacter cloacae complex]|uniref:DNA-binding transcriptional repressor CitR n=1 Tax=Enterobacter cloacae complex TaxID=354276 RepID=UPI000F847B9C|nr:LysR substrate-binding domain-containing protein [Enterobacter hormaechei]HAV1914639.1 LysR family transcriptional regulator [Enterobacter hormaechei subsp. steigerwaltii]KAA0884351.1 LysR family transcriptional regulator [Enterobacter hormaechei]MBE8859692.1 LysR family transcriptional regulator [Enterobacter hormaechei]MCL1418921.1 LysR family transcriptional regulator [Enterobacter hormaechei]MCL1423811.1 LysR family transcriptional regulator [Enterobacter hormaechei]
MANLYDLKKFDLNLLVIFECIYQHLSISKAAETLYITPSAVSQSLQRLRGQLNDPLFIRSGKGITPTTVGTNLHHHLEQNLNQIEQTINMMHHSDIKKKFVIYCSQMVSPGYMLEPMKLLISEENYDIEQRDMLISPESAEDLLAYRKADLIFTIAPVKNRSVVCVHFTTVPITLICRENHPRLTDTVSLEALYREKFTFYQSAHPGVKEFQNRANDVFPERNIAFRTDSISSLISMVSSSDLLGFIPISIYEAYKETLKLKRIAAPFELPEIHVYMLYSRSSLNSSVFSTFIEKMHKLCLSAPSA